MKTVLYGGAFDPPHLWHEAVIRSLLSLDDVERVLCVPSGYRTEKAYKILDWHRRALLSIFGDRFLDDPKFSMDYDCLDGNIERTTTVGMYEHYKKKLGIEPYQVFGTEEITSMPFWFQSERVLHEIPKLLIVRNGFIPDISTLDQVKIIPIQATESVQKLSSTLVREGIGHGSYEGLCPEIRDYIQQHHLYEPII